MVGIKRFKKLKQTLEYYKVVFYFDKTYKVVYLQQRYLCLRNPF